MIVKHVVDLIYKPQKSGYIYRNKPRRTEDRLAESRLDEQETNPLNVSSGDANPAPLSLTNQLHSQPHERDVGENAAGGALVWSLDSAVTEGTSSSSNPTELRLRASGAPPL